MLGFPDSPAILFQFTPLREGRPGESTQPTGRADFNSRPSARGDPAISLLNNVLSISIHAPPRGATETFVSLTGGLIISIHAPPRGATKLSSM